MKLETIKTYKILFPLVNLFVIKERGNVFVALAANVANVEVFLLHVLSHVNFELNLVEKSMATKIAREPSQSHVDVFVFIQVHA